LEQRPVRAQKKAEDFILVGELTELRMAYLAREKPPIRYLGIDRRKYTDEELVSRFYVYVVEAGGEWEKFRKLLPERLRSVAPDAFLRGDSLHRTRTQEAVEKHLPYLQTSPWLRARVEKAMRGKKVRLDEISDLAEKVRAAMPPEPPPKRPWWRCLPAALKLGA
jgi:hypothetical protein